MRLRQSEAAGHHLPSAGLAACVLGLVLCPFAYIAIGALRGFAPAFSFLTLPPLLASAGYLLYRFLSRPPQGPSNMLLLSAEVFSWILIGLFLVVVSGFTLVTRFERFGLSATLFLVASLVSLPVVLLRRTALQQRLSGLPRALAIVLLLAVLVVALVTMVVFLLQAPAFP
jgi:hypothetical protein